MISIAVTVRKIKNEKYHEIYNAISDDWLELFYKLNINPILFTDKDKKIKEKLKNNNCLGLILTNGEDSQLKIDNHNKFLSGTKRDFIEYSLVKYCIKFNLPIAGFCRGHQFLNRYFGGSIKKISNHAGTMHNVKIIEKKFIRIYKRNSIKVNSYHDNTIKLDSLASILSPWAVSDNTVEGFYNTKYKIISMMWHPERRKKINKYEIKLIKDHFYK